MANRVRRRIAYLKYRLVRWSRRYRSSPIALTNDAGTLKNIVSNTAKRVRRSAWLIVGGLGAEVVVLLLYSAEKTWLETALLIICNLAIAAGVLGEDHFAHQSGEAATRLQQISDEKIATAEQQGAYSAYLASEANSRAGRARREAAKFNERAAALEKENLQLKAAISWRTIAPADLQRLTTLLAKGPSVVRLEYVKGDPETQNLAAHLRTAFMGANWRVELKARTFMGAAVGLWVLPNATPSASTSLAVSIVGNAFTAIGLAFGAQGGPAAEFSPGETGETWGPNSPPVKVIVGSKPEPTLAAP